MECIITKGSAQVRELLYRGTAEQPIDSDFTLPDYCPDIGKLLKCRVFPSITLRELRGGNVCIEGVCAIRVIYLESHDKSVRCCERELPFSLSIPAANIAEASTVVANAKLSYVNCRATSQRRLDIHGAFTVNVSVYGSGVNEYIAKVEGAGVRTKDCLFPVSRLVGQCRASFGVSESMELPQGKPPVASIVRSDSSVVISETKPIANKLIIKGELRLEIVYCTDSGSGLESMEYQIPFNQVVDINGLDDSCLTDIRAEAVSTDISLKTDSDGEYRRLTADVRVCADITAWAKSSVCAVCDAYSVERELELEKKRLSFENFLFSDSGRASCSVSLTHDKEISEVLDCWCEAGELEASGSESGLRIRGNAALCAIVRNSSGDCDYIEKSCALVRDFSCPALSQPRVNAAAAVNACGFTISGSSKLELRAEAELRVSVYDELSIQCLAAVTPSEQASRRLENCPAVVMYFAGANEELWDIARSCSSSVELIKEENGLSADSLAEDTLLLVTVR